MIERKPLRRPRNDAKSGELIFSHNIVVNEVNEMIGVGSVFLPVNEKSLGQLIRATAIATQKE